MLLFVNRFPLPFIVHVVPIFRDKAQNVISEDGSCVFVRFEGGCSVIRRYIDR